MEETGAFIMITALAGIIAVIFSKFMDYLLKRKIISSGQMDEKMLELIKGSSGKYSMLKWGILFLFGGMGLIVLEFIPFYVDQSPIPYGIEALFLAMGFLLYYKIFRNEK